MAKKPSVPERLRRQVQERAQGRCEYCLIHESDDCVEFSGCCFVSGTIPMKLLDPLSFGPLSIARHRERIVV